MNATMTNQTTVKDPLIHFPFYINQYQGLLSKFSFEEKGAFISLLCAFLSEDGILPENINQVFRICGAFEESEKLAISTVMEDVKRVGSEILKIQREKRKKCREAARIGGLKSKRTLSERLSERSSNTETDTETDTEIYTKTKIKKNNSSPKVEELSDGLKFVLEAKLNRKLNAKSWKEEIRKLLEIDLKERQDPVADVKRAIQEVSNRFGEQYFPAIQSASALREKFSKVEAAIARNQSQATPDIKQTYFNLKKEFENE